MNLSGDAVSKYLNFYKLDVSDVMVIQDDLDMELGTSKLLFNRGDGGHNGIKDIILKLGSKNFLRVKIGIGKYGPYVLFKGKYVSIPKAESILTITLDEAIELIEKKKIS
jgi:PTH1 family peptidyl-tRNA hydrolase